MNNNDYIQLRKLLLQFISEYGDELGGDVYAEPNEIDCGQVLELLNKITEEGGENND